MKLFEVLDPVTIDPDRNDIENVEDLASFVQEYMGGNLKKLGSGSFAVVYERPDDPGTVTKVSKGVGEVEYLKEDGYLSWLRAMANHRDASGNPYLPKIYSVKFYFDLKDEDRRDMGSFRGPFKYVAELERLEELYSDADEDIEDDADEQSIYKQYALMARKMFKNYRPSGKYVDNVVDDITSTLAAHLHDRPAKFEIKDKKLAQALRMVKDAQSGSGGEMIDMKAENIMVRRTPYGLQPVLTDPVA